MRSTRSGNYQYDADQSYGGYGASTSSRLGGGMSPRRGMSSPYVQKEQPSLLSLSRSSRNEQNIPPNPTLTRRPTRPPVASLREWGSSPNGPKQSWNNNKATPMSPPPVVPRGRVQSSFPSDGLYGQSYTGGNQTDAHSRTVTIFGFPSNKTAMVISRFQKYGEVIQRQDGAGNWVHLTYKDSVGYQNALYKNGEVIGDVMVGVKGFDPLMSTQNIRELPSHRVNTATKPVKPVVSTQQNDPLGMGRKDAPWRKKSFCQSLFEHLFNV